MPRLRRLAQFSTAFLPLAALVLLPAGCDWMKRDPNPAARAQMFGPVSIRIHPTFTQVKDWTGDGTPDGIEALLEVRDQFGEPIRAAGRVIFELYDYRQDYPDPRGKELTNPWIKPLTTREDQEAYWNGVVDAYSFNLALPEIEPGRTYVLTASFEVDEDRRLFDQLNLGPRAGDVDDDDEEEEEEADENEV